MCNFLQYRLRNQVLKKYFQGFQEAFLVLIKIFKSLCTLALVYVIVKAKVSLKVRVEANLRSGPDSKPKKPKIAELGTTEALFFCGVTLLRIKNLLG